MDIYTIYANHTEDVTAHEFVALMRKFLDKLVEHDKMVSYRITRCKLGFRSMEIPEFRIDMEFNDMAQLDAAMGSVIRNDNSIETEHVGFNQYVADDIQHFLYRDFPDE